VEHRSRKLARWTNLVVMAIILLTMGTAALVVVFTLVTPTS
jgi:hypothetical protein